MWTPGCPLWLTGGPSGYVTAMDDTENTPRETSDPGVDDLAPDQDAEPSLNAPASERPDGLEGVEDDESMDGDGTPS